MAGVTAKQILETADWSSVDTFWRFYLRDTDSVQALRQSFDVQCPMLYAVFTFSYQN